MTITYALIPARAGSERVPGKNTRLLGGKPLLVWTIDAARAASLDDAFVSSASEEIGAVALEYGATWIPRPAEYATSTSPDIEWVQHALAWLRARELKPDILAILRPTSPFRDGRIIRAALDHFIEFSRTSGSGRPDSLRTMRIAREHPAKIWLGRPNGEEPMTPAYQVGSGARRVFTAYHSRPTQTLPRAYVQTAGMELVWREAIERTGTITGNHIVGWLLEGAAALDINDERDWEEAEAIVKFRAAAPHVEPYHRRGRPRVPREVEEDA